MGQAMELITGRTTAAGATLTAVTVNTGNSLGIRSADIRSKVGLLVTWSLKQAAGLTRIRSPRLHDNNQGYRVAVNASNPSPYYLSYKFLQPLIAQDVLVVESSGSATAGALEFVSLLVYYADLPGVSGRYVTPDQVAQWGANIMGQQVALTFGATGDYTGQVAINSGSGLDQWKANTDYALMGYAVDAPCQCIRLQGVDTGNLGVGGPGYVTDHRVTANWFATLSDVYGLPLVPVVNSANKFSIMVDGVQDNNAAAVNVTFNLVELRPATLRT